MRSNTTHYRFLPISINGFPAVDSKTRLVLSPIAQSMMNNALDMLYQLERHNSNFMNKKLDLPPLYVYAHRQPSVERDANSNMVGTVCVYVLGGTGDYTQHAPDFSEYLSTSAIKGLGAVGDYIDAQDVVLIIAAKEFLPLRRIIRSLNFREFPLPAGYVVGVDGTVMCVDTGKNAVVSAISVRTSWLPLEVSIGMPGWRELNTVEERRYRVAEALPMSHPFDQTAFKIRPSRVVSVRRLPPSHVDAVNALSKVLDVKMSWSSVHPIDSAMEQFYPLDLAIDTAINSSSTTTSARILFI